MKGREAWDGFTFQTFVRRWSWNQTLFNFERNLAVWSTGISEGYEWLKRFYSIEMGTYQIILQTAKLFFACGEKNEFVPTQLLFVFKSHPNSSIQCCGTVTVFWGSGFGGPTLEIFRFLFRFRVQSRSRIQTTLGSLKSCGSYGSGSKIENTASTTIPNRLNGKKTHHATVL